MKLTKWASMASEYHRVDTVGDRIHIIKRDDRKSYYARYNDNLSEQKLKSLKTTNLKQARINAQRILRSLEEHTHDIVEEVGQHKHITFRDAVDQLISRSSNAPNTLRSDNLLNALCNLSPPKI